MADANADAAQADRRESSAEDDAARVTVRSAGYCVLCDRIVELADDGACGADERHPRAAISCRMVLGADEPVPSLARFNLAAFLIPPIWGPAHAQWAGAIFLPLWLFADSVVASAAGQGPMMTAGAVVVAGVTVGAQAWFSKRANGLAWRKACGSTSLERFAKRQHIWAIVAVPTWLLIVGWAVSYRVADSF